MTAFDRDSNHQRASGANVISRSLPPKEYLRKFTRDFGADVVLGIPIHALKLSMHLDAIGTIAVTGIVLSEKDGESSL